MHRILRKLSGWPLTVSVIAVFLFGAFLNMYALQTVVYERDREMAMNLVNGIAAMIQDGSNPYNMQMAYDSGWEPASSADDTYIVVRTVKSNDGMDNHWDVTASYVNGYPFFGRSELVSLTCYAIWDESNDIGGTEAYVI